MDEAARCGVLVLLRSSAMSSESLSVFAKRDEAVVTAVTSRSDVIAHDEELDVTDICDVGSGLKVVGLVAGRVLGASLSSGTHVVVKFSCLIGQLGSEIGLGFRLPASLLGLVGGLGASVRLAGWKQVDSSDGMGAR